MSRRSEIRDKAVKNLQEFRVLMLDGHFDFGNGYHGRVYLNPHQLFRYPSTIWRFAQDLLEVLPASVLDETEVVAGPATGGALLAHTVAGLLDSRRAIGGRNRHRDGGDLRSDGSDDRRRRAELRSRRIQGARKLFDRHLSALPVRRSCHDLLGRFIATYHQDTETPGIPHSIFI